MIFSLFNEVGDKRYLPPTVFELRFYFEKLTGIIRSRSSLEPVWSMKILASRSNAQNYSRVKKQSIEIFCTENVLSRGKSALRLATS